MSKKLNDTIKEVLTKNPQSFNITKALEEMSELSEKLLKYLNKSEEFKPKREEIVEEIGDVLFRVKVLAHQFGKKDVKDRIEEKRLKIQGYINNNTYSKV